VQRLAALDAEEMQTLIQKQLEVRRFLHQQKKSLRRRLEDDIMQQMRPSEVSQRMNQEQNDELVAMQKDFDLNFEM